MGYWPHYGEIPVSSRATYIDWLAQGRRDPNYGIGYVFLFFYGLEHRIFVEKNLTEYREIVREVEELLSVYGSDFSFQAYASRFLAAVRVLAREGSFVPDLSELRTKAGSLSADFKIGLASRIAQGPLSGDWLLAWLIQDPNTNLRTPATRCFEEFKTLFLARFSAKYPQGLSVRQSNRRMSLEYQSASGAFTTNLLASYPKMMDPEANQAPLEVARKIATDCTDALDAYSRYVGRNPNAAGSLEAKTLLPPELKADLAKSSKAEHMKAKLAGLLRNNITQTPLSVLLDMAGIQFDASRQLPAQLANRLIEVLAHLDVGLEPDFRAGGKGARAADLVTIFRAPGGALVDTEKSEMIAARVMVEVAVLAAKVEGNDTRAGLRSVLEELDRLTNFSQPERLRLYAYIMHLSQQPQGKSAAWQKLAGLPLQERERIAHVAVSALTADGRIEATEIKFAERLYGALGIPKQRLYNDLHERTGDEPKTVKEAEVDSSGVPIPQRPVITPKPLKSSPLPVNGQQPTKALPKEKPVLQLPQVADQRRQPVVEIDRAVLDRTRRDTSHVRNLLADIFNSDDVEAETAAVVPTTMRATSSHFSGLDLQHAEILQIFWRECGSVQRSSFDAEVRRLGLFAGGVLETLNEWSFDQFGEALIEEGDPLIIPPHLFDQLNQMARPQ